MPNQHKRPPVSLRLPGGLEAWYRAEAARRKTALNALAVEALQAFRGGPQEAGKAAAKPAAAAQPPPEPTRTVVLGYSKERQARGRQ